MDNISGSKFLQHGKDGVCEKIEETKSFLFSDYVNCSGGYISGVEVSQYYQQRDVPYQCVESLSDIEC